jgi:hypothetical protein
MSRPAATRPLPPSPVPFPVEATVNGVRVTVTLMFRLGTIVERERANG